MEQFDVTPEELEECPDDVLVAIARNAPNHFDGGDRTTIFNEVLKRWQRCLYLNSSKRRTDEE